MHPIKSIKIFDISSDYIVNIKQSDGRKENKQKSIDRNILTLDAYTRLIFLHLEGRSRDRYAPGQ